MIVVDSSVWIDNLRGRLSEEVQTLIRLDHEQILLGDIILLELLQGTRDELHARRLERELKQFTTVSMLDPDLALVAARNYRALRTRGITIRKTADLVIATFCIEKGHLLLHSDRDFSPFERYLGLKLIRN